MIPLALPVPTALRKFWPWSGPDAAMIICGLNPRWTNTLMNAATVGTSTEPMRTMAGCSATSLFAAAVRTAGGTAPVFGSGSYSLAVAPGGVSPATLELL